MQLIADVASKALQSEQVTDTALGPGEQLHRDFGRLFHGERQGSVKGSAESNPEVTASPITRPSWRMPADAGLIIERKTLGQMRGYDGWVGLLAANDRLAFDQPSRQVVLPTNARL